MSTDFGFLVGYNGSAFIQSNTTYKTSNSTVSTTQLLVTSASVVRSLNIPSVNSFYTAFSGDISAGGNEIPLTSIRLGYGVYNFSGNLNFELTENAINTICTDNFFNRNNLFHLTLMDGMKQLNISNCCWSSISFSYASNEIPTCSIAFLSNNATENDLSIINQGSPKLNTSNLIKYWNTGGKYVNSFNVSFSRNVSPIYHNGDLKTPSYLKPGKIDLSLDVTYLPFVTFSGGLSLKMGSGKTLTLSKSVVNEIMTNKQFNITGLNDAGMKTYSFNAINDAVSGKTFSFS